MVPDDAEKIVSPGVVTPGHHRAEGGALLGGLLLGESWRFLQWQGGEVPVGYRKFSSSGGNNSAGWEKAYLRSTYEYRVGRPIRPWNVSDQDGNGRQGCDEVTLPRSTAHIWRLRDASQN